MARTKGRRSVSLFSLVAAVVLVACGDGTTHPDPDGWRPALTRAITELRRSEPEGAVRVENLVAEAEAAQAAVTDQQSAEVANRAWSAAMVCAADELRRVREAGARLAVEARLHIDAAAREIALADETAMAAGSAREHARAAQAARVQLRRAEGLEQSGDLEGALAAADDAMSLADAAQEGWRRQQERLADPKLRRRWRQQVADTLEVSRRDGVAVVIVDKAARRLRVYLDGKQVEVFKAELGSAGLAPKRHAGDRATPEGRYLVTAIKTGGETQFYKALLLDYPNEDDRRRHQLERAAGTIPAGVGPGSMIEIHGRGGQQRDWTDGCVALRDEDMDRLLELVPVETPVTIVGTME